MSGYLIDTSALSRGRHESVRRRLEEVLLGELVYTCPVIDLEYLYSARSSDEYELWLADRRGGYESIPLTPAVGDRALDVQRAFARLSQHRGASLPDLLIAACAEAREATVLHYDSDYELIAGVTAQSVEWVVPRGSVP